MTADPGGFDLGLAARRRRIKLPPGNAGSPFTARGMTPLLRMDSNQLNWITNFVWGIADDVLRDLYVRGKYRDVILPMTVLRRLDAVLEPTKQAVLDMKVARPGEVTNQDAALRQAAVRRSTNLPFTLRDFGPAPPTQLKATLRLTWTASLRMCRTSREFEFRNKSRGLSRRCARHADREVPLRILICPKRGSTTTAWARC
jgi:hypothetical protein